MNQKYKQKYRNTRKIQAKNIGKKNLFWCVRKNSELYKMKKTRVKT